MIYLDAVCLLAAFLGCCALAASYDVVERESRRTDHAEHRATLAQARADEAHAALIWAQVSAAAEDARRDFEATPIHDEVAVVRLRRELDAWGES